uniref:ORF46b n=1 Tax=Pinus koraiensis TaxID=88728 RepID=Q85X59_PINKO|nr:ORF46b [Pinus koraiensis]
MEFICRIPLFGILRIASGQGIILFPHSLSHCNETMNRFICFFPFIL